MKNQGLGTLSIFTAAGFYGLYGIFSRLIGSSFGNFSQNWARNLIVLAIISTVVIIRKKKLFKIRKKDIKWLLLWFLSGSWITVLTFIAFNNIPIGTTYLVIYAAMILSGFLSGKIFFDEKLNKTKVTSLMLSLLGLSIIYRFSIDADKIIFVVLGFVSGFMTGIWNTISKKFSGYYPNNQIVMMDAGGGVIASLVGAMIFKEAVPIDISYARWFWVFAYAVVQTVNVGLIVYGFKNIEAQKGSIILPVEIIFAFIFSFIIFKEIPLASSFVGGVLIIIGALLPNIKFNNILSNKKGRVFT